MTRQEKPIARTLIETIVRKALRDIQDDPERSMRNLVDMAQEFAKGRFQQHFFRAAQKMLQNDASPYYSLVRDVSAHVEHERLLSFGMNLGYNGCTLGAKKIRYMEEKEGFHIPWSITLHMPHALEKDQLIDYQRLIAQGEALGVYVWFLFARNAPESILPLASAHPDSAFVLFLPSGNAGAKLLEEAGEAHNVMLAIRFSEKAMDLMADLREKKLLYASYQYYSDETAPDILSGNAIKAMQQFAPVSVFVALPDLSESIEQQVYQYVSYSRHEQLYRTLLWEYALDNRFVDTVISGDACSAAFTSEGTLCTQKKTPSAPDMNFHDAALAAILKRAFPQ